MHPCLTYKQGTILLARHALEAGWLHAHIGCLRHLLGCGLQLFLPTLSLPLFTLTCACPPWVLRIRLAHRQLCSPLCRLACRNCMLYLVVCLPLTACCVLVSVSVARAWA